jgi:hypothetical protein
VTETSTGQVVETPAGRRKVRVRVRVKKRSRRHIRRRRVRRVAIGVLLALGIMVVLGILAVFPALETRGLLADAASSMRTGRTTLLDGKAGKAEKAFADAHAGFLEARSSVRHPLIRLFGFLPIVGRSPDATTAVVEAAVRVADAGRILAAAVKDLPGGPAALAPEDGAIPLAPLRQLAGPLTEAEGRLDEAAALMDAAPEHWVVPPVTEGIEKFSPQLEEAHTAVGAAASLTRVLPAFLGDDEPKRYFVAAQNPAELRGTGGLIGSYAILTVRDGALEFGDFRPVSELDTVSPDQVEPPNPDYARVWDRFESRGYWSNVNMTADFPSAAVAIERLYEETEGVELDGVIATDPFALAALLQVVGSVDVPGTDVALTPDNAVDFLTHDAYTALQGSARKFLLGDAAEEVLSRFIGGPVGGDGDIPRPGEARREGGAPAGGDPGTGRGRSRARPGTGTGIGTGSHAVAPDDTDQDQDRDDRVIRGSAGAVAFGRVLVDVAADGHLLLHSTDPRVQAGLVDAGVAGNLPQEDGDFLAVTANAGSGTKIDYYLKRAVHYEVDLAGDGGAQAVATVSLANTAPSSGEPRYVIGPHPFTDNEAGDNYLYMSTYCASSCSFVGFDRDGQPDGVAPHEELGHPLFQVTSHLPSGGSEDLAFRWQVADAWTDDGGRGVYRLVVAGQTGIRPMRLSLAIDVPDGMRVTDVSPGMKVAGDEITWEGAARDRMVFEVRFERNLLGRIWHSVWDFLTQPVIRL